MFCTNCGNKVDENAYVCVSCGVLLKKRIETKNIRTKNDANITGKFSLIFGFLALISSLSLFLYDISSVGMYTEIYERILYALDYSLISILVASVCLVLSLVGKKNAYSKYGLILAFLSFFFIITEFVVVVIY